MRNDRDVLYSHVMASAYLIFVGLECGADGEGRTPTGFPAGT